MFAFRFLQIFSFGICIMCVDMIQSVEETKSICGADSVLRCKAVHKDGVQYRAVRWYKVAKSGPSPRLSGLLTHSLPEGITQWYVGVQREVELLEDSLDIFLPNVTSEDSGRYMCLLAAPVGEQNQEGQVQLTVTGCPEDQLLEQMEDVYLVIVATVVLVAALFIFFISYGNFGDRGDKGQQGERGTLGRDGIPGHVGPPGIPGPRGKTGPGGDLGVKGRSGPKGVPGAPGPGLTDEQVLQLCRGVVTAQISQYASSIRAKCAQGCPINNRTLIGPPGARGPMGGAGKPGKAGKAGAKGARGNQGDRGLEGQRGALGERGQKGPKGLRGDAGKGLPGHDGLQGPTGFPGHPAEPKNGMEGPRGPRGFPGPVGIPGMAGIAGVPGICEARDCSIHAPVVRKEQGLVKGPLSPKI